MHLPSDERRSAWHRPPEIIAAEQRILTYADGLLTFMRSEKTDVLSEAQGSIAFFTHSMGTGLAPNPFGKPYGVTKKYLLERMDPDNNRLLAELLRAAWDLRCWRAHHGEITAAERDAL